MSIHPGMGRNADRWHLLRRLERLEAENKLLRSGVHPHAEAPRPDFAAMQRAVDTPLVPASNQLEEAREIIRGLLLSADCEWENQKLGHDWAEACQAAREFMLETTREPQK